MRPSIIGGCIWTVNAAREALSFLLIRLPRNQSITRSPEINVVTSFLGVAQLVPNAQMEGNWAPAVLTSCTRAAIGRDKATLVVVSRDC